MKRNLTVRSVNIPKSAKYKAKTNLNIKLIHQENMVLVVRTYDSYSDIVIFVYMS